MYLNTKPDREAPVKAGGRGRGVLPRRSPLAARRSAQQRQQRQQQRRREMRPPGGRAASAPPAAVAPLASAHLEHVEAPDAAKPRCWGWCCPGLSLTPPSEFCAESTPRALCAGSTPHARFRPRRRLLCSNAQILFSSPSSPVTHHRGANRPLTATTVPTTKQCGSSFGWRAASASCRASRARRRRSSCPTS